MQTRRRIAVAGATGNVGRHVVDVLEADGNDVVAMSRSSGVDVVTGDGLAEALAGVAIIVDVATQPSPDEEAATAFFTASARNLQEIGERAGVERIVVALALTEQRVTRGDPQAGRQPGAGSLASLPRMTRASDRVVVRQHSRGATERLLNRLEVGPTGRCSVPGCVHLIAGPPGEHAWPTARHASNGGTT